MPESRRLKAPCRPFFSPALRLASEVLLAETVLTTGEGVQRRFPWDLASFPPLTPRDHLELRNLIEGFLEPCTFELSPFLESGPAFFRQVFCGIVLGRRPSQFLSLLSPGCAGRGAPPPEAMVLSIQPVHSPYYHSITTFTVNSPF